MSEVTLEKESLLRILQSYQMITDKLIRGEEIVLPIETLLHMSKVLAQSIYMIEQG